MLRDFCVKSITIHLFDTDCDYVCFFILSTGGSGEGWSGNGWSGYGWSGYGWSGNGWSGNGWSGYGWSGYGWWGNGWQREEPTECLVTEQGLDYVGSIKVTADDNVCTPWREVEHYDPAMDPENFPDASIDDAKNYCRNPDGDIRPWCFHRNGWAFCNIPVCGEYIFQIIIF